MDRKGPSTRSSWTRRRLSGVGAVTVIAFAVVAISGRAGFADSDPQLLHASVTIAAGEAASPVPRSYLGVSTEYWSLPLYATRMAAFERVLSLLRVPGDGPLVVRFGGDSADHSFWDPRLKVLPAWAFSLTPHWLDLTRELVQHLDLRLIIDLDLLTDSPSTAARWARAAKDRLPPNSIIGFEIGNEPDFYNDAYWTTLTAGRLIGGRPLPAAVSPDDYVTAFRRYVTALHAVAPGIPLFGPALGNPQGHERWITDLLASRQPALRTISAHRYPYGGCIPRQSAHFATIARLLSERAAAGMAASVAPAVQAAHRAGRSFRLTELNSVSCGGRPGVSDAFASALWAPDALFELLRTGVDGVNLHLRVHTINAPFAVTARGLIARPLLYGLIMFARTLGTGPRLVPVDLQSRGSPHLKVWAVKTSGDRLHVLLINKGRRTVRVVLRLPARAPATIQRLLARSARSRFGTTLEGQRLGPRGTWQGRPAAEAVSRSKRGYLLTVTGLSAALLSVRVGQGVLAQRAPRRFDAASQR